VNVRRGRALALAAAAALTLTACAGTSVDPAGVLDVAGPAQGALHGTDISDVVARPALVLADTAGSRFDLRARPAGEVTAVFFGYTDCPDVCPTTMADLAAARRALPPSGKDRFEVVFVTEDPSHDTPTVLRRWLERFDPSFTGLIGGGTRTAAVLTELKAPASEVVATPVPAHDDAGQPQHRHAAGEDAVEHTGSVYLFAGRRVVVHTGGTTPAEYADDVQQLLRA
jgi:protein SCO1